MKIGEVISKAALIISAVGRISIAEGNGLQLQNESSMAQTNYTPMVGTAWEMPEQIFVPFEEPQSYADHTSRQTRETAGREVADTPYFMFSSKIAMRRDLPDKLFLLVDSADPVLGSSAGQTHNIKYKQIERSGEIPLARALMSSAALGLAEQKEIADGLVANTCSPVGDTWLARAPEESAFIDKLSLCYGDANGFTHMMMEEKESMRRHLQEDLQFVSPRRVMAFYDMLKALQTYRLLEIQNFMAWVEQVDTAVLEQTQNNCSPGLGRDRAQSEECADHIRITRPRREALAKDLHLFKHLVSNGARQVQSLLVHIMDMIGIYRRNSSQLQKGISFSIEGAEWEINETFSLLTSKIEEFRADRNLHTQVHGIKKELQRAVQRYYGLVQELERNLQKEAENIERLLSAKGPTDKRYMPAARGFLNSGMEVMASEIEFVDNVSNGILQYINTINNRANLKHRMRVKDTKCPFDEYINEGSVHQIHQERGHPVHPAREQPVHQERGYPVHPAREQPVQNRPHTAHIPSSHRGSVHSENQYPSSSRSHANTGGSRQQHAPQTTEAPSVRIDPTPPPRTWEQDMMQSFDTKVISAINNMPDAARASAAAWLRKSLAAGDIQLSHAAELDAQSSLHPANNFLLQPSAQRKVADRIQSSRQKEKDASAEIESLKDTLRALKDETTKLTSTYSTIESRIFQKRNTTAETHTHISSLQKDVSALNRDTQAILKQIAQTKTAIEEYEGKQSAHLASRRNMQAKIDALLEETGIGAKNTSLLKGPPDEKGCDSKKSIEPLRAMLEQEKAAVEVAASQASEALEHIGQSMHKVDAHLNQTVAFESACQVNMPSDAGVSSLSLAQTVLSSVCESVDQALHPNTSASSNGTAQSKCTECSEEAARLHEDAVNHCSYWPLVQEGICEQVSMEAQYAQTLQGLSSSIKHILAEIEETGIASEADLDSKDKAIQKIVSDTVNIRAQLDETLTQIREGLTRTSTASGASIIPNGPEYSKKYKTASQTLDMIGASAASLEEAESRAIARNVRAEKDLQQCLQDRAEAEGSGASSVFSEYPTEEHTTTEYQPVTVGQTDEEQTDTSTPAPQQTITAEETPTPLPQEPSISGTAATSLDDLPENKTVVSNMPEVHNEPFDSLGKEPEENTTPFKETLITESPTVSDKPAYLEKTSPIEELPEINNPRAEALISEEKSSSETPATSKSSLASAPSLNTPTDPNIASTETTISSEPAITSTEPTTPTETTTPTENNIVSSDSTLPTETTIPTETNINSTEPNTTPTETTISNESNIAFTETTISNESTPLTETNIDSTDPTTITEPNTTPTETTISNEPTTPTEPNIDSTDPTLLIETTTPTEINIDSTDPTTPTETTISNEPTTPTETSITSSEPALLTETTISTETNVDSNESAILTETTISTETTTPTEPNIVSNEPTIPTENNIPTETTISNEPTTPTETTISSNPNISGESTPLTETNITPTEPNIPTETTIFNEPAIPTVTNIISNEPTIPTENNSVSNESTPLTETTISNESTTPTETTISTEPNIASTEPILLTEKTISAETTTSSETNITSSEPVITSTEPNIPTETTISSEPTTPTETNIASSEPAITSSDPTPLTETTIPTKPTTTSSEPPTTTPSIPAKDVSPSANSTAQNTSEASAIEDPALKKAIKPNRRKKIFNNPLKFKKLPQINRTANEENIF